LTKKRRSRSGETSCSIDLGYSPDGAFSIPMLLRSVPYTISGIALPLAETNSVSAMANE
jgi:hypothetical protein